ncbi:uncharacterized protein FOMMEDRAFT_156190 [Fomitiporia mediterranea MF3/22]|uniref:uncharacterized protein n=1 Tax=Fomitiporia mediterranea (strain MF3/22) TaxID=694068 RepID=UPI0004407739|nr:uncharacterized protein FOMMEDRAFT_156190 [Fomitiporia mediterranea MF3/22]EJD02836.1 hypothetical protein FOMMEDRAFT_156190 [Fomitiporia mediterranea MF3/22]
MQNFQHLFPNISKTRVVGPTTGVLGAVLICLAIFLYIRRRTIPWPSVIRREHRKKNAEESVLPAVPENENNAVSLTLRLESGRRSWTGHTSEHGGRAGVVSRQHLTEATNNILKHPAPSLNNVPESLQSTPVPMSSVMQEMDNIRARMAELERQQQETRRNLHLSSVDSGEANDNRSDQRRWRIQMTVVTEISDYCKEIGWTKPGS